MKELLETDRAYLAGFFDGDGCINISKSHPKHSKSPRHVLQVVVAQADRVFLEWWAEQTGLGKVYEDIAQRKVVPMRQRMYHWRMTGQQAEDLLRLMLPFLIVKLPQARIALEFRKIKHNNQRGKGLSPQTLAVRDMLMARLAIAKRN